MGPTSPIPQSPFSNSRRLHQILCFSPFTNQTPRRPRSVDSSPSPPPPPPKAARGIPSPSLIRLILSRYTYAVVSRLPPTIPCSCEFDLVIRYPWHGQVISASARERIRPWRRRSSRSWTAPSAPKPPTSGALSPTGASSSRYAPGHMLGLFSPL